MLTELAVDLGDGTYAVRFRAGGKDVYVRVDGEVPTGPYDGLGYAQPGAQGAIWAPIMEKAYAFFRRGANTYASLDAGFMGSVLMDFGIANDSASLNTVSDALVKTLTTALSSGHVVTMSTSATVASGVPAIASNCNPVLSMAQDARVGWLLTRRNPWAWTAWRIIPAWATAL